MPIARHRPRRFHSRFHSPAVTSYGRADSFSVDYIIHVLKAPITNLSSALSPLLFFFFTSLLFSFSFLFIASFASDELACPVTRRGDFVSFDLSKREEGSKEEREGGENRRTLFGFSCALARPEISTRLSFDTTLSETDLAFERDFYRRMEECRWSIGGPRAARAHVSTLPATLPDVLFSVQTKLKTFVTPALTVP